MPYASGRVIHDADAHIMEVPGFLENYLEAGHRATVTDKVLFPRHEGFHSHLKDDHRQGIADGARGFDLAWQEWLNLRSLLLVSRAIATAAAARRESRGAQWREDFPQADPERGGLAATLVGLEGGRIALGWQPVEFSRVRPGESLL